MKKNGSSKYFLICLLIFFLAVSDFFISCNTTYGLAEDQVFTALDYSLDDIVNEEIKRIEEFKSKDFVKALWRAWLLNENKKTPSVKECYDQCLTLTLEKYKAAIEEKNYMEAYRIYSSLESLDYEKIGEIKKDFLDLEKNFSKDITSLKSSPKEKASIADCVKGTVTVWVDRGIKIEKRLGFADVVLGSGFFISKNGYIVTNHHVIESCVDPKYEGYAHLYIKLSGDTENRIPAKVVGFDKTLDLALLKTEVDAPYYFDLGGDSHLEVGDKVYAIGSPVGLESTLTSGVISSTARDLNMSAKVFQLDAAVNSGNSGGPLIDQDGKIQAVVFASVQYYDGLNFAIPIEYLKNDLPFLFAGGEKKHIWIGSYGKTKRLPGSGTKEEGVLVNYVQPGSSAFLGGIKENDLIYKLNGKNIYSVDQLHSEYIRLSARSIAKFSFVDSEGNEKEMPLYLEERPAQPGYSVYSHDIITSSLYPIFGIKMATVSSANKNLYVITDVMKNSTADLSGFSVGDTMQLVNAYTSSDNSLLTIEVYAKKRKNGFVDMGIGLAVNLNSPYYF